MLRYKSLLKIKVIIITSVFLFSCTEDYWDSHYEANPEIVAESNLWETIQSNPELSKFAEILQNYGYVELLSQSQSYTVFAPDNSALSVLDTTNYNVKTELIENHIARFFQTVSTKTDTVVSMLNGKRIKLGYKDGDFHFGGATFNSNLKTIVASNGIVHVLSKYEMFFPNIWEYLAKRSELDSLRKYMYSFDKIIFLPEASVPGSVLDGQQTYLDSVFINNNLLLAQLGYLNREDSSYTMLAPNNTAWIEAYDRIKSYFVFYVEGNAAYADSMQRVQTSFALVKDLIYNNTIQTSPDDSLVSTSRNTFYKPLEMFEGSERVITSNGYLNITSQLKIDALDSWHKPIKVEAERSLGRENTLSNPFSEKVPAGFTSISSGRYLKLEPTTSSGNPTVTFEIPNNLSDYYDIYCVFLSQKVLNPLALGVKPFKVYFSLTDLDITGKISNQRFPSTGTIETNIEKIDTVLIQTDYKFAFSSYGEEDSSVKLKVVSNVARTETANYSRELLIDCILLEPKKK